MPDKKYSEFTEDTTPETTDTTTSRRGSNNFRATWAQYLGAFFGANQILKADSALTVTALTVAEQTLLGRITAGVITALTVTQVRTLLAALYAASAPGVDNILVKTDGTGHAMQATGISVADSTNDVTGLGLINSQRIPDGAGTAAPNTTLSATSAHDNRATECSHVAGCTVSVNSGTAGSWRAFFASASGQTVTIVKGTLTTLYVPPLYDQGSSSLASDERYAVVGVFYLTSSVGIGFGRMVAA